MSEIVTIGGFPFIPWTADHYSTEEMTRRSAAFYEWLDTRRSVRDFSSEDIPSAVIDNIIRAASTAPSGAHRQPWTFCVIKDPSIKRAIREAAEEEEQVNYSSRMNEEWIEAVRPLQTDWHKPFLETAPYLIAVFKKVYDVTEDHSRQTNYYVSESVGLACGMLLAAIHHAGLATLTHTPSPMKFLTTILNRPENERPFLLLPVGYPAENAVVPVLHRKSLQEVSAYY